MPCLVEWPAVIRESRQSSFPGVTSDVLPTLLDVLGVSYPDADRPLDGTSLLPVFRGESPKKKRHQPIGFWTYNHRPERENEPWFSNPSALEMITRTARQEARAANGETEIPVFWNHRHPEPKLVMEGEAAWMNSPFKLIVRSSGKKGLSLELYDVEADPRESLNVADSYPEVVEEMRKELHAWQESVEKSLTGADYE